MDFHWVLIEVSEGRGPTNPQPTPYQPPTNAQSMPNQKRTITGDKQRGIG